jgi:nucleotide-binding universal stress UspA family protein
MTRVLAAVDSSATAGPVLAAGAAMARLFGADVTVVHVRENELDVGSVVRAAGLELVELDGVVVDALSAAGSADDVALIVLGARRTPGAARPVGRTALAVATRTAKPVLLVPPDALHPARLTRILVPLEGTVSTSLAPRRMLELAGQVSLDVVVLHVLDEASLPAFTDQPQHESEAWAREFLERYCPVGLDRVRLELRVGSPEELVPQVAQEIDADLIALGWSRELEGDRAPIVRAALARGHRPVLLLPVKMVNQRRESFARSQSWHA